LIEKELSTLVLLFVFGIVGGILANKFKQPLVLGFLLVGTIIGPFALNLINDHHLIDMVIEFGAILLMFVVGLEFSPEQIKKVGVKGFILSVMKMSIMLFFGFMASVLFGLSITESMFVGIIFSFTSTVVVVKVLEQKGLMKKSEVPLMLAMVVVEDIAAVVIITMLVGASSAAGGSVLSIMEKIIIGLIILVLVYVIFLKFANKLFNVLLKDKSDELLTFLSLALCAGLSYLAYFLGMSPTAGAFLAGSIVAAVKDSKELGHAIMPHNLIFSSLFFIAIGTLIDFKALIENIWVVLFLLGVFVVTIFIGMGLTTYLFANMRKEQPIFCALAMIPLGEFSLLIAKEAKMFNTSLDFVTITAALIFLTTIVMSLTVSRSKKIYEFLESRNPSIFKRKIHAMANYFSAFFEQLDTENSYTNKFKTYASKAAIYAMISVMMLIGIHKLTGWLIKIDVATLFIAGILITLLSIVVFFLYLTYVDGKEAYRLSVNITSYVDKSMNVRRAGRTLRYLMFGLVTVSIGLISPGILFILQLPVIYSIIPVGIVALGIFIMSRVFKLLNSFSNEYVGFVPEYKKYDAAVVRFQQGKY
jgi:Kef-type K+ transport system membrane component KefB